MRPLLTLLLALALAVGFSDTASAQRRRRAATPPADGEAAASDVPSGPTLTVRDLPTVLPALHSSSPDEVRAAIDQLIVIDAPECVAPLAELLRSGQPDAVTDRALDAMRSLAAPSSIEVLTEFTHHRRPGARRRAYRALAAIEDRRVADLLEGGLRDSDRDIRANCALALGTMGSRASIEILFRAFDRGVVEAATAIGQVGVESTVARFNEHLGHAPLSVMLAGYDGYLRRSDISAETKIDIVNRLGEVAGRQVREFLASYLTTFGERDRSRLRQTVFDTLSRIPLDGAPTTGAPATTTAPAGGTP
jgi:HEAT repeat protein